MSVNKMHCFSHLPPRLCNINYIGRPTQIVCMAATVHIMCMQMVLRVHENLCTVLIPLCKNNLNLPISHTDHYLFQENKNNLYHSILNFQHSNSATFLAAIVQHSILNLSHPYLKLQVSLIDQSQYDIQMFYGLQIDNGI